MGNEDTSKFVCQNEIMKPKIAIVGLGGAGTNIVSQLYEYMEKKKLADVYVVNSERWGKMARVYSFNQIKEFVKVLSGYKYVILTAGLGSKGGDYLVYLTERLDNISGVFVASPFIFESERVKKSLQQLISINSDEILAKNLNSLLWRMPNVPIALAFEIFDKELAVEIVNRVFELI